ncbi:hypothetical protein DFJ73DRAFT_843982 [Zopfochytrium polystomum]|nr:hypothetical protein DFJ73DRAFT_843982 [Zopfochytrium polystomum]
MQPPPLPPHQFVMFLLFFVCCFVLLVYSSFVGFNKVKKKELARCFAVTALHLARNEVALLYYLYFYFFSLKLIG